MKKLIPILFLALLPHDAFSQSNVQLPTNNTIIRLTVTNDNGEVLMRKTQYGWMTLSMYYNKRQNINEAFDELVSAAGIEIMSPNLSGVFTYKYKFKSTSDIRLMYSAKYKGGTLKSANPDEELHWLTKEDAIEKLKSTVTSLGEMTAQILAHPQTIWGGSFILFRKEGKLSSEIEEDFYQLSGN